MYISQVVIRKRDVKFGEPKLVAKTASNETEREKKTNETKMKKQTDDSEGATILLDVCSLRSKSYPKAHTRSFHLMRMEKLLANIV